MKGIRIACAAALAAAVTLPTWASTGPTQIVTRHTNSAATATRVYLPPYEAHFIEVRPVLVPEAVVARPISVTPTHPYLIPLTYGNATTIYIDPEVDYVARDIGPGRIDDGHSILVAQRVWRSVHTPGVRVLRAYRTETAEQDVVGDYVPVPILKIPKPAPQRPTDLPRPMAAAQ